MIGVCLHTLNFQFILGLFNWKHSEQLFENCFHLWDEKEWLIQFECNKLRWPFFEWVHLIFGAEKWVELAGKQANSSHRNRSKWNHLKKFKIISSNQIQVRGCVFIFLSSICRLVTVRDLNVEVAIYRNLISGRKLVAQRERERASRKAP